MGSTGLPAGIRQRFKEALQVDRKHNCAAADFSGWQLAIADQLENLCATDAADLGHVLYR